jgi:hypothetical protein
LDSVSVRVDELVKDGAKRRRLRWSWILDKLINTNNWQPSDQGRHPDQSLIGLIPAHPLLKGVGLRHAHRR